MKKVLLVLMVLVTMGLSQAPPTAEPGRPIGSQDPLVENARAALKEADSKLPAELTNLLSPMEAKWALYCVDNLRADDALVVMLQGFGYGMDGYAAYIQLSSWQKLFAMMYFAELVAGNADKGTAVLVKTDVYKEFLRCSNALAGRLAGIKPMSVQKLRQGQLKERRKQEEEQEEKYRQQQAEKARKERAKLQQMQDDRNYVQKITEFAVKDVKLEIWELKKAEEICFRYGWEVPNVICKSLRKEERKEERKEWLNEMNENRRRRAIGLGVVSAIGLAVVLILLFSIAAE